MKHPTHPADDTLKPQMILTGHEDVGFAIDWNENKEGYLISGSNQGDVCIWNVEGNTPASQNNESKNIAYVI
jgi:histone-binding protein RBBP4